MMSELKEVQWTKADMVEVNLKEPDDFLKVRETLTRIGVASRKEKSYSSLVTFFIRRVNTILFTSKNYSLSMARKQTCQRMMCRDAIVLSNFYLTGDW